MARELLAGQKNNKYKIIIGKNSISQKNISSFTKGHNKLLIISDTGVPKDIIQNIISLSKLKSKVFTVILDQGEKAKSLTNFQKIINFLVHHNFDRSDGIIAIGGGVIGDISGFVASAYLRGIPFIQVPTTLLAQVDSSIGGKTAINIPAGKNLVGTFYNPSGVIIDTTVLSSLSSRQLNAGLAEVIKYGFIQNKYLLFLLSKHTDKILDREHKIIEEIIFESIKTKAKIVTKDEKETGVRALLNFGHTFGHAIEASGKYKKILHGEAVAKGMLIASKISLLEGLLTEIEASTINDLLLAYGFDLDLSGYKYSDLKPFIFRDKKVQKGKLNLVLLKGISNGIVASEFDMKNLPRSML